MKLLKILTLFALLLGLNACKKQNDIVFNEAYLQGEWKSESLGEGVEEGVKVVVKALGRESFLEGGNNTGIGKMYLFMDDSDVGSLKYTDENSWSIEDGKLVMISKK